MKNVAIFLTGVILSASASVLAQEVSVDDNSEFTLDETVVEEKPIEVSSRVRALMATSTISLDRAYALVSEKDSTREITARLDILISLNREILKRLK